MMFFQQAIGMDCPLDGASNDQPLLKNQQFNHLISKDPRYKHLNTNELTEQLIEQAYKIIDQGICLSESSAKEE